MCIWDPVAVEQMNKELSEKVWAGDVNGHMVRDCPALLKVEASMYSVSDVHLHSISSLCTPDFSLPFPFRATWTMNRSVSRNYFRTLSSAISFLSNPEFICQCLSGLVPKYLCACKTLFCSMTDVEHDRKTNIYVLNHGNSGVHWSYPVMCLSYLGSRGRKIKRSRSAWAFLSFPQRLWYLKCLVDRQKKIKLGLEAMRKFEFCFHRNDSSVIGGILLWRTFFFASSIFFTLNY